MNTLHVYDSYGRLKKTTETIETGKSLTLEYDYDNKGQLNQVTYPNSRTLQYEYAYGDLKKMTWMSNTGVWEKVTDNAKGQPTSVRHGNGIETTFH